MTASPAIARPAFRRLTGGELCVCIILAYIALGAMASAALGRPYMAYLVRPGFLVIFPALALVSLPVAVLARRRRIEGPPLEAWREALAATHFRPVLLASILTAFGFNAFAAWKAMIPTLRPFAWDVELARWDRILHGGPPERLVGWLPVWLIDPAYAYGWTIALAVGVLALIWQRHNRALLAMALTWIVLGTVVALAMSSAGPVYFEAVTGLPSPYAEALVSLEGTSTARIQSMLWENLVAGVIAEGGGISAFPSVHVAVPVIFALAWRSWGWAAWGLLIFAGSIRTGWHYALDGEAAVVLALGCWWLAAKLDCGNG